MEIIENIKRDLEEKLQSIMNREVEDIYEKVEEFIGEVFDKYEDIDTIESSGGIVMYNFQDSDVYASVLDYFFTFVDGKEYLVSIYLLYTQGEEADILHGYKVEVYEVEEVEELEEEEEE